MILINSLIDLLKSHMRRVINSLIDLLKSHIRRAITKTLIYPHSLDSDFFIY